MCLQKISSRPKAFLQVCLSMENKIFPRVPVKHLTDSVCVCVCVCVIESTDSLFITKTLYCSALRMLKVSSRSEVDFRSDLPTKLVV